MYTPTPMDTSDVELPDELLKLTEKIAEHVHDIWAKQRIKNGWRYGIERNDILKTTPCLVAYHALSEDEKNYDRCTAIETLKFIVKQGYSIHK